MNRLRILVASLVFSFGLMFAVAVPAMAAATNQIQAGLCTGADLYITDTPTDNCSNTSATASINKIVRLVINLLSVVVGIVAVVMIIVGGLRYITSGGNDTSVTGAKNTILYAIIGLVVVALAQVIVKFTLNKLTNS